MPPSVMRNGLAPFTTPLPGARRERAPVACPRGPGPPGRRGLDPAAREREMAVSDNSKIEWTDASWNCVTGCTKVSPGCDHCYAETFAERWRGIAGHHFEQGFDVRLWPERLEIPLRWKRPRRILVNSIS